MTIAKYRVTAQHVGSFDRFGLVLESNVDSSPEAIRREIDIAFPEKYEHVIVERMEDA